MEIPSLLRSEEHAAISALTLTGSVVDIGGDTRSSYRSLLKGEHTFVTINADTKAAPDILHDLEYTLPCQRHIFDHAILVNVLEHVFEYRQLLNETVRIVKPGGTIVIVVPFLFPVHPSPHDFHRFTVETLKRECERSGMEDVIVSELGKGVFSARYVLLDRLFPWPLRLVSYYTLRYIVIVFDTFWTWMARCTGRKYRPSDYALGYIVKACAKKDA